MALVASFSQNKLSLNNSMTYISVFLQICIGLIAADIFSGFFHWIEDNYLDDYCSNIPVISSVIKDNEFSLFI